MGMNDSKKMKGRNKTGKEFIAHPVNWVPDGDARPGKPVFFPFVALRVFLRAVPGDSARVADGLELGETVLVCAPAEIIDCR